MFISGDGKEVFPQYESLNVDRGLDTCKRLSLISDTSRDFSCVHPLMVPERGAEAEGLSTFIAFIRLISSVNIGVLNEVCAP